MFDVNEVVVAAPTDKVVGLGVEPLNEVNEIELGKNVSEPPPPLTTMRTGTVVGLLAAPVCANEMEPL